MHFLNKTYFFVNTQSLMFAFRQRFEQCAGKGLRASEALESLCDKCGMHTFSNGPAFGRGSGQSKPLEFVRVRLRFPTAMTVGKREMIIIKPNIEEFSSTPTGNCIAPRKRLYIICL